MDPTFFCRCWSLIMRNSSRKNHQGSCRQIVRGLFPWSEASYGEIGQNEQRCDDKANPKRGMGIGPHRDRDIVGEVGQLPGQELDKGPKEGLEKTNPAASPQIHGLQFHQELTGRCFPTGLFEQDKVEPNGQRNGQPGVYLGIPAGAEPVFGADNETTQGDEDGQLQQADDEEKDHQDVDEISYETMKNGGEFHHNIPSHNIDH
jgi:hypothetical protein